MEHYNSSSIKLNREMLEYFFRKRTEKDSIFKIFAGIRGNENIDLERKKYQNCIVTFHFSNYDDMLGQIKRQLEYKSGRTILSYMKTILIFLVEDRKMTDLGYFHVVVF